MTENISRETADIQDAIDRELLESIRRVEEIIASSPDQSDDAGAGRGDADTHNSPFSIGESPKQYPYNHYHILMTKDVSVSDVNEIRAKMSRALGMNDHGDVATAVLNVDRVAAVDDAYLSAEETIGLRRISNYLGGSMPPGADILNCVPSVKIILSKAAAAPDEDMPDLSVDLLKTSALLTELASVRMKVAAAARATSSTDIDPALRGAFRRTGIHIGSKPTFVARSAHSSRGLANLGRALLGGWRVLAGHLVTELKPGDISRMVSGDGVRYFITLRNGHFYLGEASPVYGKDRQADGYKIRYTAMSRIGMMGRILYAGRVSFGFRMKRALLRQSGPEFERIS